MNNSTNAPSVSISRSPFSPYTSTLLVILTLLVVISYLIAKWNQRAKSVYVIPRVFALCSPRTVQYHYELILRVGLPSHDFNPDRHDIDLTVLGKHRNEVVPTTRLNTKTLYDEPLITNLSLVVYRLVEMPSLGGVVVKHSGPFGSHIFAYDFTIIDLATNKEFHWKLGQYVGSIERVLALDESKRHAAYPIDDVPAPQRSYEDLYLVILLLVHVCMFNAAMMPIRCTVAQDIYCVLLNALFGLSLALFLDWYLFYNLRWNTLRREYFNDPLPWTPLSGVVSSRITLIALTLAPVITTIFFTPNPGSVDDTIIWLLVGSNASTIVLGLWNVYRQLDVADCLATCGLKCRGVESVEVGMSHTEYLADIRTKSGSSTGETPVSSQTQPILGVRSSVKSFGFDPMTGRPHSATNPSPPLSGTGATPNNRPAVGAVKPVTSRRQSEYSHSDGTVRSVLKSKSTSESRKRKS